MRRKAAVSLRTLGTPAPGRTGYEDRRGGRGHKTARRFGEVVSRRAVQCREYGANVNSVRDCAFVRSLASVEAGLTANGNKSRAAYHREWRRRKRGVRPGDLPPAPRPAVRADPRVAFDWIEATLRVPTGPLTAQPFRIPKWQREWLMGASAPGVREAGLSVSRKNGKSGIIAAWLLAHLVGPLNVPDWQCVVTSLTGPLAKELREAVELTAKASGLWEQIKLRLSPPPGSLEGANGARVRFLAADKATGHALGADLALIDEAGLLAENKRALWNALFTSISGRNGAMWSISIQGDGPMFAELEQRAGSDLVHWQRWQAPADCDITDEAAWHAANPGVADGIKSFDYMRDAAERASASPGNEMHFRAYDLNQSVDPDREVIVRMSDYAACVRPDAEPLTGDLCVGIDIGGSASMTAAAAVSLDTGRVKVWGAFPDDPALSVRARHDRMGSLYDRMVREGELRLYPGKVTPVVAFLRDLFEELSAYGRVVALGADRYRKHEVAQALADARIPPYKMHWRGQGASATSDGSHDVRSFQRAVYSRRLNTPGSTMLEAAIASSVLRFDGGGNPALDKAANNARIDALSAAVIAWGLAAMVKPSPQLGLHIV